MISEKILLIIVRVVALAWLFNGIGHWLIIFGVFNEDKAPKAINIFFHSGALWCLLVAFGLWNLREWARLFGIFFSGSMFLAHLWLIYQQIKGNKKIERWRLLELLQIGIFIIFVSLPLVRKMFL